MYCKIIQKYFSNLVKILSQPTNVFYYYICCYYTIFTIFQLFLTNNIIFQMVWQYEVMQAPYGEAREVLQYEHCTIIILLLLMGLIGGQHYTYNVFIIFLYPICRVFRALLPLTRDRMILLILQIILVTYPTNALDSDPSLDQIPQTNLPPSASSRIRGLNQGTLELVDPLTR